jgi:hypothetical protein
MTTHEIDRAAYAKLHELSTKSVGRYIEQGRLPATKRGGKWWIPADALVAPSAFEQTSTPGAGTVTLAVPDVPTRVAGPTIADVLDRLPAYLSVDEAARFLGIKPATVKRHAREFGGRKFGGDTGQAWVIPQATVRRLAGLHP